MKIYFVNISGGGELNSLGMAKCFANKAEAVKAAKQFCRESDNTDFEPEMIRPIEFANTKKGILGLIDSIEGDIVGNYGGGYLV